jgi:hypothetical protein
VNSLANITVTISDGRRGPFSSSTVDHPLGSPSLSEYIPQVRCPAEIARYDFWVEGNGRANTYPLWLGVPVDFSHDVITFTKTQLLHVARSGDISPIRLDVHLTLSRPVQVPTIQSTVSEHSVNIQRTFSQQSVNTQFLHVARSGN